MSCWGFPPIPSASSLYSSPSFRAGVARVIKLPAVLTGTPLFATPPLFLQIAHRNLPGCLSSLCIYHKSYQSRAIKIIAIIRSGYLDEGKMFSRKSWVRGFTKWEKNSTFFPGVRLRKSMHFRTDSSQLACILLLFRPKALKIKHLSLIASASGY